MRYAIVLVLFLAGCAGSAEVRATNALAIACDTWATTLDTLTQLRKAGKVSDANHERILATIGIVTKACGSGRKIDPDEAIEYVDRGIGMLRSVKDAIGGGQ